MRLVSWPPLWSPLVTRGLVHACIRVVYTSCFPGHCSVHPRGTCWLQSYNWPSEQWSCLCTPIMALFSDSSDYVVCPWSALLSAAGSLSFQNHISHIEAAPFKAPELLQEQSDDEQPAASQVSCGASLWHLWACPGERPGPRTLDLSSGWHPQLAV